MSTLGDNNSNVRIQSLISIAQRNDTKSLLLLGQTLHNDPAPSVRLSALKMIALRKGDIANEFIHAALKDKAELINKSVRLLNTKRSRAITKE